MLGGYALCRGFGSKLWLVDKRNKVAQCSSRREPLFLVLFLDGLAQAVHFDFQVHLVV
jgi:hypothetical protein